MSETHQPSDDEIVSAYLDGEATPAERAAVESNQDRRREVEILRKISASTGMVAPPLDAVRERNVAAALAVFDAESNQSGSLTVSGPRPSHSVPALDAVPVAGPGTSHPASRDVGMGPPTAHDAVSDLDQARRRRQARSLTLLGVAAAAVLVVVMAGVLLTRSSRSSEVAVNRAAAPSTTVPAAEQGRAGGAPRPAERPVESPFGTGESPPSTLPDRSGVGVAAPSTASSGKVTTSPAAFVGDLGTVSSGTAFRSMITDRIDAIDADAEVGGSPATFEAQEATAEVLMGCMEALQSRDAELGKEVMTATATVDGKRALILAFEIDPAVTNANGAYRAYALDNGCKVLDVQTV